MFTVHRTRIGEQREYVSAVSATRRFSPSVHQLRMVPAEGADKKLHNKSDKHLFEPGATAGSNTNHFLSFVAATLLPKKSTTHRDDIPDCNVAFGLDASLPVV